MVTFLGTLRYVRHGTRHFYEFLTLPRPFGFYSGRFSRWALLHLPDKFLLIRLSRSIGDQLRQVIHATKLIYFLSLYIKYNILCRVCQYFIHIFLKKFLESTINQLYTINVELSAFVTNIGFVVFIIVNFFQC